MVNSRRPWALILLLVPAGVNCLAWVFLVSPRQAKLHGLQKAQVVYHQQAESIQSLKEFQPRFESIVQEGSRFLADLEPPRSSKANMVSITQEIQQMAAHHHVQIAKMDVKRAEGSAPEASLLPLEIEAAGQFNRLAYWMNELEGRKGFRVDSWTLSPEKGASPGARLILEVTAFMRGD